MDKFRFLDLSGYGMSGKLALIEMIQEFDEQYHTPHYSFEFALLRIKDGLLNLSQDVIFNWSPYRCNKAIDRYRILAKKMAYNPKWFNIFGRIFSTGMRYEAYFNSCFLKETEKYLNSLVEYQYTGLSPYPFQNRNLIFYSLKKLFKRIFDQRVVFKENIYLTNCNKDIFYEKTRNRPIFSTW